LRSPEDSLKDCKPTEPVSFFSLSNMNVFSNKNIVIFGGIFLFSLTLIVVLGSLCKNKKSRRVFKARKDGEALLED
jgi:hypothetical protein